MRTVQSLAELTELVGSERDLYVRWSRGPRADRHGHSRDPLTGGDLPGLSASPLAVEPWWEDRSLLLWVARRLYDYRHLSCRRADAQAWVFIGRECGRGPDNEPLVECLQPVAWVTDEVTDEAARLLEDRSADWGPLERS